MLNLGLLPALGGSIAELQRSGQGSRFIDGYLRAYAEAFGHVWYFSYQPETLADYTGDLRLLQAADVLAPARPLARSVRALQIPVAHAGIIRRCGALRAFQITGVIPALIARRRFGVPFVTSYGFWYGSLSDPGPKRLNPIKRKQMEERVQELEEEINRLEDAIADCEASLQTFVSAEQSQCLTQELADRRAELKSRLAEWEELGQALQT